MDQAGHPWDYAAQWYYTGINFSWKVLLAREVKMMERTGNFKVLIRTGSLRLAD